MDRSHLGTPDLATFISLVARLRLIPFRLTAHRTAARRRATVAKVFPWPLERR